MSKSNYRKYKRFREKKIGVTIILDDKDSSTRKKRVDGGGNKRIIILLLFIMVSSIIFIPSISFIGEALADTQVSSSSTVAVVSEVVEECVEPVELIPQLPLEPIIIIEKEKILFKEMVKLNLMLKCKLSCQEECNDHGDNDCNCDGDYCCQEVEFDGSPIEVEVRDNPHGHGLHYYFSKSLFKKLRINRGLISVASFKWHVKPGKYYVKVKGSFKFKGRRFYFHRTLKVKIYRRFKLAFRKLFYKRTSIYPYVCAAYYCYHPWYYYRPWPCWWLWYQYYCPVIIYVWYQPIVIGISIKIKITIEIVNQIENCIHLYLPDDFEDLIRIDDCEDPENESGIYQYYDYNFKPKRHIILYRGQSITKSFIVDPPKKGRHYMAIFGPFTTGKVNNLMNIVKLPIQIETIANSKNG